jgi:acyl dehydratase
MTAQLLATQVAVGDRVPTFGVPVTARMVVMGASASRDWQPQHHDHAWAVRANARDIFVNTPTQAGWIERYLTDWTGPKGRLGRVRFRMKRSVCPGDVLHFDAVVTATEVDATGCAWATLDVELTVDGTVVTACTTRLALPRDDADNPWARARESWRP